MATDLTGKPLPPYSLPTPPYPSLLPPTPSPSLPTPYLLPPALKDLNFLASQSELIHYTYGEGIS